MINIQLSFIDPSCGCPISVFKPGWTGLGQPGLVEGVPAHDRVWNEMSLKVPFNPNIKKNPINTHKAWTHLILSKFTCVYILVLSFSYLIFKSYLK